MHRGVQGAHGDSISRNNISSIGSAQQSDSVHGNNKYVAQKIPTGSNNTRNQTRDTSSRMNYVSQPANIARPSKVEKNFMRNIKIWHNVLAAEAIFFTPSEPCTNSEGTFGFPQTSN